MIMKNHKETIKKYFFDFPTARLRVREIERELAMPLPSVIRYVKELVDGKIVVPFTIGKTVFYTAARTERKFVIEKKLHNIKKLYDSGLVEALVEEYNNSPIIVFGSYSRGEDGETSDID